MTPNEHYREAERLLADSATCLRPNDEGHCEADRTIAEAQVHATLATAIDAAEAAARTELDALREAVAALLHDTDTSPDSDAHAVIERFREGLPDTAHGEPVLFLAYKLMVAEGASSEGGAQR